VRGFAVFSLNRNSAQDIQRQSCTVSVSQRLRKSETSLPQVVGFEQVARTQSQSSKCSQGIRLAESILSQAKLI